MSDVTGLLQRWRAGDEQARNALVESVHGELQQTANRILAGERHSALQASELVNECIVRMFGLTRIDWQDRVHFLALSATVMRRVLVDQARQRNAEKRRGYEVTLITDDLRASTGGIEVAALHEALTRLETVSKRRAQIVELKCFGGMTNQEIAEALGISESAVKRSWRTARAWLYVQLQGSDGDLD